MLVIPIYLRMNKSQANKLGKLIREELKNSEIPSDTLLNNLQIYRTSFQKDISEIFETLTGIVKSARKDSIICFRIKGIQSILSKIKRDPNLDLGTLNDIAGCRVLVYHPMSMQKVITVLTSSFKIKHIDDYRKEKKEDGTNGCFLYIQSPINADRVIEVQIKTVKNHKLTSMFEIVDTIFDANINERKEQPDFKNFLSLFSNKSRLNLSQKEELLSIDRKHKIYKTLNEIFIKNYMKLRSDWLTINSNENPYFIIEIDESKTSHITSYSDYETAEKIYFNKFKEQSDSNILLTHIEKPNFKKLSIAYKSYLLIKHDYMNDWDKLTSDILDHYMKKEDNDKIISYKEYIQSNLSFQIDLLNSEFKKETKSKNKADYSEYEEWFYDLEEKLLEIQKIVPEEQVEIKEEKKRNFWSKMFGE